MHLYRVKVVTDGDGHWYVVPVELADTFTEMLSAGEADEYNAFNEMFSMYRTGGDLNNAELWAEVRPVKIS